jgi:hypothetical protein
MNSTIHPNAGHVKKPSDFLCEPYWYYKKYNCVIHACIILTVKLFVALEWLIIKLVTMNWLSILLKYKEISWLIQNIDHDRVSDTSMYKPNILVEPNINYANSNMVSTVDMLE